MDRLTAGGHMELTPEAGGQDDGSRVASTRWDGGVAVVSMSGELDLATAPAAREELEHVLKQGGEALHVDMSGVAFVDSTGLGVLVWAWEQAREKRMAYLVVNPSATATRVLEQSGLARIFSVETGGA